MPGRWGGERKGSGRAEPRLGPLSPPPPQPRSPQAEQELVCTREPPAARPRPPSRDPAISAPEPLSFHSHWTRHSPLRLFSPSEFARVGKSRGQEVRDSALAGRPGPGGPGRTPGPTLQSSPSSGLCPGGRGPPPAHPGSGPGAAELRLATLGPEAGGRGRWLRAWGRVGTQGEGARRPSAGSRGAGRLGLQQRVPPGSAFGLRAGGELWSPARLAGPGGWPRAGLRDRRRRHRHIDLLAGRGRRRRGRPLLWRPKVGWALTGRGRRGEAGEGRVAGSRGSGAARGAPAPVHCALCGASDGGRGGREPGPWGWGGAGVCREGGASLTRPRGSQRELWGTRSTGGTSWRRGKGPRRRHRADGPSSQPGRLTAAGPLSPRRHFRRRPPPPCAQSLELPRTPPPGDWNAGHVATRAERERGVVRRSPNQRAGEQAPVRSALATSLATRGAGGSAGRPGRGERRAGGRRGGSERAGGGGELTSAGEYYGLSCAGCCFSAPGSSQGGKRRVNMELSAVGERVFAAEALLKRRIRKVGAPGPGAEAGEPSPPGPGSLPLLQPSFPSPRSQQRPRPWRRRRRRL